MAGFGYNAEKPILLCASACFKINAVAMPGIRGIAISKVRDPASVLQPLDSLSAIGRFTANV
jgi:hypothetical protein